MNIALHIAQIAYNDAINVKTRASLAAREMLKKRTSKLAHMDGRRLVKVTASRTPCTGLEYHELGGSA